jgi:N6-adenosine-specific RNA methylase IME4/ParB-like chromosome segregation protein Spo0J
MRRKPSKRTTRAAHTAHARHQQPTLWPRAEPKLKVSKAAPPRGTPDTIRDVGLSGITVLPDRMRLLRPEVVHELAISMQACGQLQPIVLRPHDSIGFVLVAGRHRLEAARSLKWDSISAIVRAGLKADTALLAEIDENLARGELSPAERAAHIGRRKELYEALHPETKHGGAPGAGRGKGKGKSSKDPDSGSFQDDTAKASGRSRSAIAQDATRAKHIPDVGALAGTSLDKGEELDALAKLSPAQQAPLIERAVSGEQVSAKGAAKAHQRDLRMRELTEASRAASAKLGTKLYDVLYIDPPWKFETWSEKGMDRSADNHYPTMSLEELCALKLPAAKNCAMYVWTPPAMWPQAIRFIEAHGCKFATEYVWVKDKTGTGYWARNQHESLLLAIKGDMPAPAPSDRVSSVQYFPRGKHSEKPDYYAKMIEKAFPRARRLEMFARKRRPGWDSRGNEVED